MMAQNTRSKRRWWLLGVWLLLLFLFPDWERLVPNINRWPLKTSHFSKMPTDSGFLKDSALAGSEGRIDKEFDKVAKEIELRLGIERDLFLYQFVMIAGVFSVILAGGFVARQREEDKGDAAENLLFRQHGLPLLFGIAATGLLMVGMHIRINSMIISELGEWTSIAYEREGVWGWETYLKLYSPYHSNGLYFIIVGTLWMPCAVTLCAFVWLDSNWSPSVGTKGRGTPRSLGEWILELRQAVRWVISLTLLLFVMVKMVKFLMSAWCWIPLLWLVCACGVIRELYRKEEDNGPDSPTVQ